MNACQAYIDKMDERQAKTYAAEQWIGTLLAEYRAGDPSADSIADAIRVAVVQSHDIADGPAPYDNAELAAAVTLAELARALSAASSGAVRAARMVRGATWDQIGNAFGITRQAAQQRWGDE